MGKIVKVSGPLVVATGLQEANMADVVRVGEQGLIGEVLTMNGDTASIQVYEETSGLGPGAEVVTTGAPLSVELGPGLIENIYDGIQRPLEVIMETVKGNNLPRGVEVPALDREKKWDFQAVVEPGDPGSGGRHHRHGAGDPLHPPQDHDPAQDAREDRLHPVRLLHRHRNSGRAGTGGRLPGGAAHDAEVARPRGTAL